MGNIKMKVCTKCKAEKPLSEFGVSSSRKDGLEYNCRACMRDRYLLRKDAYNAKRRKAYHADPERRKRILSMSKEYRERNKEKIKLQKHRKYTENRDVLLSEMRVYYEENKDRKRMYDKQYRKKNRERLKAADRERYLANKDAYYRYAATRRARENKAEGSHTKSDVRKILKKQRYKCAFCGCCVKAGYHVDHVVALASGGTNWPDNLQILCPSCNCSKGAKCPIQFAQENGKLL